MSNFEQVPEQASFNDSAVSSRLSLSREACGCSGSGCQRQPIDSSFVGPNGDLEIANANGPRPQMSRYYENSQSYGYDPQQNPYTGGYYRPYGNSWNGHGNGGSNIPHAISDVVTQRHSGYYQPYGNSWNSYGHGGSNIPHAISDAITQRHSGYYQPYGHGWNGHGYRSPNLPHIISDVMTQRHSGHYQPHGYGIGHTLRHGGHSSRRHR